MITFFIIAFIIVIIIIAILLVNLVISYFASKYFLVDEHTILISFKQFKSLYPIAPDKWHLEDNYITYQIYKPGIKYHPIIKTCFFKHFIDYIQYIIFLKQYRKERKENIQNSSLVEILAAWQKDINGYRQKSLEELKTKRERIDKEISKYQMEKIR